MGGVERWQNVGSNTHAMTLHPASYRLAGGGGGVVVIVERVVVRVATTGR